ncbi:tripartite tricarboxylate transporter substrate binding protein [Verticiella sediminum]|uniref:Tripartite tricarboxylate transporter substrate binding protein n=1 Tax=Verticiella sediminum TaxID=1247510 RepID=A0A556A801_9BURK|nr:tripartite tricarboxylate transporter substrate binding protein [Verticiella sediminum]TSH89024.1 tripartite tricarboxylate transporter substrate binding protein [Verticiella sediminum]
MSTFQRYTLCLRACLLAAAVAAAGSAAAQTFPSRPLTIIVPYAAGATDQQARQMAEIASRELGQTIVVENREGAGGMIGANFVASSKPDGHTILYGAPAVITVAPLLGQAPYGYDDLKALARANIIPHLLAARADAPFKTLPELVAYAKANPGKVTFGSPGNGTAVHLAGEAFAEAAGIELSHVPYRGVAPAITAAAGGFVDLVLGAPGPINPQVDSGRLRALAQFGEERTDELSSVPTLKEEGVDLALRADFGFFVPKDTPEDAMERLQAALKTAIESDAFRKSVTAALSSPAFLPADEYQKVVDDEYAVYSNVVPKLSLGSK